MKARVIYSGIWVILTAAYIAPLWAFKYIPTQDGPSHLANAVIIHRLVAGEASLARDYYTLNRRVIPTTFHHYALALLCGLFPPLVAEKILLTLLVLFCSAALWFAAGEWGGRFDPAVFLAFPLIYALPFNMGFFGWMWSLAAALFGAALFWRYRSSGRAWVYALWAAAAVAIYFCHPLGWALFAAAFTVLSTADAVAARRRQEGERWRVFIRKLCRPLCLAPAAALAVWFAFTAGAAAPVTRSGVGELLAKLAQLAVLFSYFGWQSPFIKVIAAVTWLAFAVAAAYVIYGGITGRRPWSGRDLGFAAAFLVATALYLLFPNAGPAGGSYIHARLAVVVILVAVLGTAGALPRPARAVLWILAPLVALLHLGVITASYRVANRDLAVFMAASGLIKERATILPVVNPWLPGRFAGVNYLEHAASYYALAGDRVDLLNYEAALPYFPVKWRAGRPPAYNADDKAHTPVIVYNAGEPPADYILGWEINPFGVETRRLLRGYALIYSEGDLMVFEGR